MYSGVNRQFQFMHFIVPCLYKNGKKTVKIVIMFEDKSKVFASNHFIQRLILQICFLMLLL